MSEDKVRRKDLCGSVRAVYVIEKLPDLSGPGPVEVGRYRRHVRDDNLAGVVLEVSTAGQLL
jgi:hypothetical protein